MVTFYANPETQMKDMHLTKRQIDILNIISKDINTSVNNLVKTLGYSKRTTERELEKLQQLKYLRRIGNTSASQWDVFPIE